MIVSININLSEGDNVIAPSEARDKAVSAFGLGEADVVTVVVTGSASSAPPPPPAPEEPV